MLEFFLGNNTSPRQNGRPRNNRTTGTPSATGNRTTGEPLKFDGEFDFEQANARFTEEIEKGFEKLKVADGKDKKTEKTDEKDTSMTQSMSQQEMQDQAHIMMKQKSLESMDLHKEMQKHMDAKMKEDQDMKDFYDKNISFFDRISCESNDKLINTKPKNWKEERKINAETFGIQQRQHDKYNKTYNNYHRNNYRNNYNNHRSNYNNNMNMNNSLTQPQSQNYRGNNNQMRSNYNQRPQNNNNMRNNNNGYRRTEVEVNGNSQRRFGSR